MHTQVLEDYVEARRIAGNIHQIIAGGWSKYYGAFVSLLHSGLISYQSEAEHTLCHVLV